MYNLVRFLPAKLAHDFAGVGLSVYSSFFGAPAAPEWQSLQWQGLNFPNPLGIAGGVDKNAEYLSSWENLGCGFIEIGTVTPLAQKSNSGKIMDRDWAKRWLWNKMGFPSAGAEEVYFNLLKHKAEFPVPIFVNIGKNRHTSNDTALQDYLKLVLRLNPVADAFVVNISSPNTQGLRDLQAKESLQKLISNISKLSMRPVLVKLSPDLSTEQLTEALEVSVLAGAKGFVLTNTTLSRPENNPFPTEGGVSGEFVRELSLRSLKTAHKVLGKNDSVLLVSAGGVLSANDVLQRLELGAHLVQSYSGLVFNGPGFFLKTLEDLKTEALKTRDNRA
jgi:dihydroorotate dehydrogenase